MGELAQVAVRPSKPVRRSRLKP